MKKFKNKKIIQPHGIFDYLARDLGLEIVATTQGHGQEPSTAEIINLIKIIKNEKVGAIASEPQYSDKIRNKCPTHQIGPGRIRTRQCPTRLLRDQNDGKLENSQGHAWELS